jgi:hypothetical protein
MALVSVFLQKKCILFFRRNFSFEEKSLLQNFHIKVFSDVKVVAMRMSLVLKGSYKIKRGTIRAETYSATSVSLSVSLSLVPYLDLSKYISDSLTQLTWGHSRYSDIEMCHQSSSNRLSWDKKIWEPQKGLHFKHHFCLQTSFAVFLIQCRVFGVSRSLFSSCEELTTSSEFRKVCTLIRHGYVYQSETKRIS